MKLWLYVTLDEYELPIAVADSCKELADMLGINAMTIYSALRHVRNGTHKRTRYMVIDVEDD